VKRQRPINADLPVPNEPEAEPELRAGRKARSAAKPSEPKKPGAGAAPAKPSPVSPPAKPGQPPRPKPKAEPAAEPRVSKPEPPKPRPVPVSKPEPPAAKAQAADQPPPPPPRARRPRPLTPFVLAGLVAIAVVFILAAVLGGTGGSDEEGSPAPVPSGGAGSGGAPASAEELGFPAFATNNTTRVGGSDAASTAAAVALAVFPSTTERQRPRAVTLVGEEDWAGALAAAVLMAEPVRAPVLIAGSAATSEALDALDPAETHEFGGQPAQEAVEILALRDRLFGSPPANIVIVPSEQPEIAVPAAAWAARSGDPVLFAGKDDLPAATATALRQHAKVPVYVLGPSSAISSEVLRGIDKISGQVKRVSGEDPVANAIAFARYGDGDFGWDINDPGHGFVLAGAASPIQAAVSAPLSGSGTWGPLLLTDDATKLPAELRSYLLDVKPGYTDNPTRAFYNHVWVIGDQEAIDVGQQAEVDELAELTKIGGGE
jgi:hypothetical protein